MKAGEPLKFGTPTGICYHMTNPDSVSTFVKLTLPALLPKEHHNVFYVKDKSIFKAGESLPLLRDQQASDKVLQYVVDALNQAWKHSPEEDLQPHPEPMGGGKPLARG